MLPHSALDKFHSLLIDDDAFNDAVMKVALEVVSYYYGGEPLDDDALRMAGQLADRVSVS